MGIFLDVKKVFDSINNDVLPKKLYYVGIRGTENDLVRSYLTNRLQVVNINGKYSDPSKINHGVQQGTVLGPIFFIMYINGLLVEAKLLCFADNMVIFSYKIKKNKKWYYKGNKVFKSIKLWFDNNFLELNSINNITITNS